MKIWLDDLDIKPAPKGWIWCKRAIEVIMILASTTHGDGRVYEMSLDNDLGKGEPEGYTILDWLEEALRGRWGKNLAKKLPKIHVHSENPIARKRMETVIARLEKIRQEHKFI